jgi:hypothetical protein
VSVPKNALLAFFERFAGGLRFPQLFWLTAILFVLDLLIPDLVPFADEILLGLATLLLGNWKRRRGPENGGTGGSNGGASDGRVIDVTPER